MSSCSVMIPFGFVSAMSCRDIGGNGPPPRDSNQSPLPNVQSVRRKLFGDVDHLQTQEDLETELRQCEERDKNKYNFDFVSEQPINSPDSRYEWSQCGDDNNDPEVKDNNNKKLQQLSTKLCKISDEVIANTSQSQSVSSSSKTSSPAMSSSLVLKSRPTSATISLDSQSLASSSSAETVSTTGQEDNLSESRVNSPKQSTQTTITAFFDGRKSAESERKRSAVQSVSHKDRQTTPKRHRLECSSAVKDTDTTDDTDTAATVDDEDSVQTTGTAV